MRLKNSYLLIIVCSIAFFLRIIALQVPMSPWWDPAIYVGMAKFLFSHGMSGLWETLRPPLWPVILGIFWKMGVDPLSAAKWLVIVSGIATIVSLYLIGEKEERGLGLSAALILTLSPIFTFLVAIPTNDIPAALLAVIAAIFILQKKYFSAGIVTALAFVMRFPNGLFLAAFGLFILIETWDRSSLKNLRSYIIASLKKIVLLALGFALLVVPYFIINQICFGDALLPLKLGREIIEGNPALSPLYYIKYGMIDNPALLLSIVGIIIYSYHIIKNKKLPASAITLAIICTVVIGGYMSHIGHKELRYSFSFMPFVVLIAAYGLQVLWHEPRLRLGRYIIIGIVILGGAYSFWYQTTHQYYVELSPERKVYYETIPRNTNTITSSPQVMLFSDTKVVGVFSTWDAALIMFNEQKETLNYVAIDSAQVSCESNSCESKTVFMEQIHATSTTIYKAKEKDIELSIFKLR